VIHIKPLKFALNDKISNRGSNWKKPKNGNLKKPSTSIDIFVIDYNQDNIKNESDTKLEKEYTRRSSISLIYLHAQTYLYEVVYKSSEDNSHHWPVYVIFIGKSFKLFRLFVELWEKIIGLGLKIIIDILLIESEVNHETDSYKGIIKSIVNLRNYHITRIRWIDKIEK